MRSMFLTQAQAIALDQDLFLHYPLASLMELAGLSIACAIFKVFSPSQSVLAVAGPGNNGGDALVAARHLHHFGFNVEVLYPIRPTKEPLFGHLVGQLEGLDIPVHKERVNMDAFDIVVDGLFGFSFDTSRGKIRPPYGELISQMSRTSSQVVSIDVPSGWDVSKGDILKTGLSPQVLVSLSAPKECSLFFQGTHHFLGGRFIPPRYQDKYPALKGLPAYQGTDQVVLLDSNSEKAEL